MPGATDAEPPAPPAPPVESLLPDNPWSWILGIMKAATTVGREAAPFKPDEEEMEAAATRYAEELAPHLKQKEPNREDAEKFADVYNQTDKCVCERCQVEMFGHRVTMSLCPKCGNKRCPKAQYHGFKCTGSNAMNQPCFAEE